MMDFENIPTKRDLSNRELISKPKIVISIITPYYNTSKVFLETYYSVMQQTYPFFEWIIVDDGSTDDKSIEQLNDISTTDPRIKVCHIDNSGPATARDYGIKNTTAESKYVFILDSDDIIEPTLLECLYWTLETHPEASFAYTDIVAFGEQQYIWSKYLTVSREKHENVISSNSMIRKQDLIEVGGYGISEKNVYEDWNLWLKLLAAKKTPIHVNNPLFWYRTSSSSESNRAKENYDRAMSYINETTKMINHDVPIIQFPRMSKKWSQKQKNYSLELPKYRKNQKITILMIVPWTVVGGADKFNLDLITGLDKEKYEVILVTTLPSENNLKSDFLKVCTECYDLSTFLDTEDYHDFVEYLIESRNVDLLFVTNSVYGYAMIPMIKLKFPDLHIIDYIHAIDYTDRYAGFGGDSQLLTSCIDHTFTCNNHTNSELQHVLNISPVSTLYIGTDEKRFDLTLFNKKKLRRKYNIDEKKKVITLVARLSKEKRPLLFIDIAAKLLKERNDLIFLIAGNGPEFNAVNKKIKELQLEESIILLDVVHKIEEVYSITDVTVLCSEREGLSLTAYESLSMGVPMVSSDVGGQKELITDKVGRIIEYIPISNEEEKNKTIDAYVKAINEVLEQLNKYQESARKTILSGFTINQMVENFEHYIKNILSSPSSKISIEYSLAKGIYDLYLASFYDIHCVTMNNYIYNYSLCNNE